VKGDRLNIQSFNRVLTAFAIVSVLGLQVSTAGGGPDQKAEAAPADAATSPLPSSDLAAIRVAIALAHKGEAAQASDVKESIADLVARKVAEWAILRSDNNEVDFKRHVAFISDNPSWPNIGLLRRRALGGITDAASARAALPKLQEVTAQIDKVDDHQPSAQCRRPGIASTLSSNWLSDGISGFTSPARTFRVAGESQAVSAASFARSIVRLQQLGHPQCAG
jgi:hypothetical protein